MKSQDLARFGQKRGQVLGEIWPGGCHMGRQGLGCTWVDPYRCQDSFPGLVGPFGATGGRFGAIFHIFRMSHIFPDYFPIFLLFPYSPGVVCPYYSLFGVIRCSYVKDTSLKISMS